MNPKLDELRRRYANRGRVAEAPEPYILSPSSLAEHTERPMSDTHDAQTNSSANQKPAPDAGTGVQSKNGQASFKGQQAPDVVRAIAAVFEPARQYRERVSRSFE